MTLASRIAMVAGEASSDLLAGCLLASLHQARPDIKAEGIGGPALQAQGFHAYWPSQKLAVHGYWDALLHYRELSGIRRKLAQRWITAPPDIFVGCDAPDFNLGLEQRLRSAGVPTVHFISPSVWAWRRRRIHQIQHAVDLMLCIFPFEPPLYAQAGIPALYVGHPLASIIPEQSQPAMARQTLNIPTHSRVLAMLPGSRVGEMKRLGPVFIQTALQLKIRDPQLTFVVPLADANLTAIFKELLDEYQAHHINWHLVQGQSHSVIEASDAVLVASGTATLECALYKKPMVIAYRVATLSYVLMKRMAYLPWIGLPNILLREFAVPEYVQGAATPDALRDACWKALNDEPYRASIEKKFSSLHQQLKRNTGEMAAHAILQLADERSGMRISR